MAVHAPFTHAQCAASWIRAPIQPWDVDVTLCSLCKPRGITRGYFGGHQTVRVAPPGPWLHVVRPGLALHECPWHYRRPGAVSQEGQRTTHISVRRRGRPCLLASSLPPFVWTRGPNIASCQKRRRRGIFRSACVDVQPYPWPPTHDRVQGPALVHQGMTFCPCGYAHPACSRAPPT